jgi:hypothetical protein
MIVRPLPMDVIHLAHSQSVPYNEIELLTAKNMRALYYATLDVTRVDVLTFSLYIKQSNYF